MVGIATSYRLDGLGSISCISRFSFVQFSYVFMFSHSVLL
jgi:hypothetical protein